MDYTDLFAELRSWLEARKEAFDREHVSYFLDGSRKEWKQPSMWLMLEDEYHLSDIAVWGSGEVQFHLADASSGDVQSHYLMVNSLDDMRDILKRLEAWHKR
ncbi:hypothetical protein [Saccharomonospora piscinae]|uniref:hypothetical protein n=1 Tax=Saccharomonospora piscinae TaxID=687388 RepID=UPI001106586D|nr:hypothetical protein [Saccharomonospora piscinae]TLW94752.1 hypothetical protein FFT09_02430 [Saccharomonospora piscinae]